MNDQAQPQASPKECAYDPLGQPVNRTGRTASGWTERRHLLLKPAARVGMERSATAGSRSSRRERIGDNVPQRSRRDPAHWGGPAKEQARQRAAGGLDLQTE